MASNEPSNERYTDQILPPISPNASNVSIASHSYPEDIITIIPDEPLKDWRGDVIGFETYSKRISEIIKRSPPLFSIGIFGGWGTGKTSLMGYDKK